MSASVVMLDGAVGRSRMAQARLVAAALVVVWEQTRLRWPTALELLVRDDGRWLGLADEPALGADGEPVDDSAASAAVDIAALDRALSCLTVADVEPYVRSWSGAQYRLSIAALGRVDEVARQVPVAAPVRLSPFPMGGDEVAYHGSQVAQHGPAVVVGSCWCHFCQQAGPGRQARYVLRCPSGAELLHVRSASFIVVCRA